MWLRFQFSTNAGGEHTACAAASALCKIKGLGSRHLAAGSFISDAVIILV